jgi:pilus assembly protein CpaB
VTARRTMILVIALVIGLVAAIALFSYTRNVEDRAYADAERVEVFVVKKPIVKGAFGSEARSNGFIGKDEIPREFRPDSALADLATIQEKVAITDLAPGQVVVDGLFVAPNQVPGGAFSEQVPKGQVAVSVSVDQVRGVGGNLLPGDKVNILVAVERDPASGEDAPSTGGKLTRHLYQNVKVLAIGQNAAPGVGETEAPTNPGSDLITFAVPPEAAQRIVHAGSDRIYLTLVPKDNEPVSLEQLPEITDETLFPTRLTPYADEG